MPAICGKCGSVRTVSTFGCDSETNSKIVKCPQCKTREHFYLTQGQYGDIREARNNSHTQAVQRHYRLRQQVTQLEKMLTAVGVELNHDSTVNPQSIIVWRVGDSTNYRVVFAQYKTLEAYRVALHALWEQLPELTAMTEDRWTPSTKHQGMYWFDVRLTSTRGRV